MANDTSINILYNSFYMVNSDDFNKAGFKPSLNGNDRVLSSPHWTDNIVDSRPEKKKAKTKIAMYAIDLTVLSMLICYLLGIFGKIPDVPHLLTWLVAFGWAFVRFGYSFLKLMAFIGKNSKFIQSGFKQLVSRWKEIK